MSNLFQSFISVIFAIFGTVSSPLGQEVKICFHITLSIGLRSFIWTAESFDTIQQRTMRSDLTADFRGGNVLAIAPPHAREARVGELD